MATNPTGSGGLWSGWPFSEFLRYWDFRPNTTWFQHFITINNNGGDAEVERTVLNEVGSYGYQLSRILDAVDVLVDHLGDGEGPHPLTPEQLQIMAKLKQLSADVDSSVKGYWSRRR